MAINESLDAGEEVRGDDFFSSRGEEPSDAEEIFEGVLRAAYEDHEYRKAERMGRLFRFVVFNPQIKPGHATISWRSFVV